MILNHDAGEDSWESFGVQGDTTNPSSRKSILNIHWKDMLKLKLQYFGHLMQRADSLEKTLMLGKIEGRRRRGRQRLRWLDGITNSTLWVSESAGRWWRTGKPGVPQSMKSQRVRHDWETEQQPVFLPGEFHGQRSWQATVHGLIKSQTWLND